MMTVSRPKFKTLFTILLIGLSIGLSACGIKADSLEPPSGANAPVFPAPYPR